MKSITEDTRIPLKWVITLLSLSGSGLIVAMSIGIWVSKIEAKTSAQDDKIKAVESKSAILESIDRRLSRIEGKMGIIGGD